MLVHNKGNYTRVANDVKVIPGANTLTETEFTAFVEHPIIKSLINSGEIAIPEGQNVASLKDLNADDAIELVKDTFSIDYLEYFRANENRKTVLAAIEAQIAEIQGK